MCIPHLSTPFSGFQRRDKTILSKALSFQLPFRDSQDIRRKEPKNGQAFNSLFGIPECARRTVWRTISSLSTPFSGFYKLLERWKDWLDNLSTPFSGFHVNLTIRMNGYCESFNSLFGIPTGHEPRIPVPEPLFQLPFRDSDNAGDNAGKEDDYFQLPFRDSTEVRLLRRIAYIFLSTPFSGFLRRRKARGWISWLASFNSLFGIPRDKGCSIWDREGDTFNSLFGILAKRKDKIGRRARPFNSLFGIPSWDILEACLLIVDFQLPFRDSAYNLQN